MSVVVGAGAPLSRLHPKGTSFGARERGWGRGLAALLALLVAFPAAAEDASSQAPVLGDLFRPVLARPGLGGLPIHAQVSVADNVVDCDILAVVARPPGQVMALLGSARGWCEFLLLHPNVKACAAEPAADGRRIVIYTGSKHFQPVETSRPQRYDLRVERRERGYLALHLWPEPAKLADAAGPARIEIAALDDGRTGLRVQYRAPLSAGARLLAATYFATFGRDKIGFSTTSVDADGNPVYIGGLAGAIERNVVRHFLAIDTLLQAQEAGAEMPPERRLAHWFALTERHARQLHELGWTEYLDIKLREFAQSAELQRSIDAQAGD